MTKRKYRPLFQAGNVGKGRASLGACISTETHHLYEDGYDYPPTHAETEAYLYVNFFKWTVSIGFIKRKGLK